MKCVLDLDLLNPPPIPSTRHFNEMHLHQRGLSKYGIKIALSDKLQALIWENWKHMQPLYYQELLGNICLRHFAPDFPNDLAVKTDHVHLSPPFLSGESEWNVPWLTSLMACYLDEQFNTDGAFLATWDRPDFENQDTVQVTYHDLEKVLSAVWSETQWDELLGQLLQLPIPFTSTLRAYADEGENWIAVVVIAEHDADSIVKTAIRAYNERSHRSKIDDIHFSALYGSGNARQREQARQLLAEQIVEGICSVNAACFIAPKNTHIDQIELYARALRDTLNVWSPNLVHPIYIDTPYDPATDELKNRELQSRIFNAIQSRGFDCRSDDIILGKSTNYLGLGLADAIAYMYFRRKDAIWRDWWQRLDNQGLLRFI